MKCTWCAINVVNTCIHLTVAGTVKSITVDAYHDGFRIVWDKHNLADNEGISYHLQVHEHFPSHSFLFRLTILYPSFTLFPFPPLQTTDNHLLMLFIQGLVGEYQPEENEYMILYRGGNNKFTWRKELQKYVPYQFRVQVRTTEGVGNWSNPVTAFKAEPGTSYTYI